MNNALSPDLQHLTPAKLEKQLLSEFYLDITKDADSAPQVDFDTISYRELNDMVEMFQMLQRAGAKTLD